MRTPLVDITRLAELRMVFPQTVPVMSLTSKKITVLSLSIVTMMLS